MGLLSFKALSVALVAGFVSLASPLQAAEPEWRHGVSLFGDLKYPKDFPHFAYVDPKAPKGGTVRQAAIGTFDNLNLAISSTKGTLAGGLGLIYDALMERALDEPSTMYGLVAEAIRYPDDFAFVSFRIRADARWHDGKPLTIDDVIFSFETFKKHDPMLAAYYRHVVKAEKTGEREVTFTFDAPGNRELPAIVGELRILPKHWWEGTDAQGRQRDISATSLELPLGSGAYRIKDVVPGRTIVYERVKDYWGEKLPANLGTNNFDEVRVEYFRDSTVALEAFKAGQIDWRTENSAKNWATAYDFPAFHEKRVILEEFPVRESGGMQAFVFNTRRDKFKDSRVRRAFNYALNYEEMNKQIFFGQYVRNNSFFFGTELASSGVPSGKELEMLEPVRAQVPPEVFTTPYTNPVSGSPEASRNNLREALRLLKEAGWEIRNKRLTNVQTGEPFSFELLIDQPTFERVALFYVPGLERLGIEMRVRTVDPTQYENRLRSWDFDMIIGVWGQSLSPGNEQRDFWGSAAADNPGSRNYVGIKNPAVDALIERIIFAKDREELVAASRALDRVLLWNHYVVPGWAYGKVRTARWDRFERPQTMPEYGNAAFPTIWWSKGGS